MSTNKTYDEITTEGLLTKEQKIIILGHLKEAGATRLETRRVERNRRKRRSKKNK